jgi:hypothetical protein
MMDRLQVLLSNSTCAATAGRRRRARLPRRTVILHVFLVVVDSR